jgi:hypothetical protein
VVYSFKGVDMSQGGEVTTQQLVYGPDGKVYGNPAQARAAGVNQTYRQDGTPYPETMLGSLPLSPSVPITETFDPSAGIGEFERRQFLPYNQPMPEPSFGGMGSADPYSQIMGQMGGGTDPYSRIMAQMTPTMNPYTGAGVAIGGYDPSLYNNAFLGSNSRLNLSGLLGGGGGMGGGGDSAGGFTNPFSDLTPAQQAAYYAANPTMASITQALQKGFSFTTPGMLQNLFNPGFVSEQGLIAMGVDPAAYQNAREGFRSLEQRADPEYYGFGPLGPQTFGPEVDTSLESQGAYSDNTGGGGYSASDYGGYSGSETQSSGESYANFKGGLVSNVFGPDPAGPDEGAGYLQRGEYVIKKSAVKKYGQGLLDMINDGKIPAKKIKSLLG